ncbi:MAG: tyrosine-type recombinase/integrase [Magnetococcales bacterium]|nr:tyrosine-type recombinase/integrase [Magnetococcales bacterium]
MPLTDTAIRTTKPTDKVVKISDGNGLFLQINPNGSRYWRLAYRFGGKQKLMALGVYPEVSLKQARERRDEARKLMADGTDPMVQRRVEKIALSGDDTFEQIARDWLKKMAPSWSAGHLALTTNRLERDVFPALGTMQIGTIKAQDVRAVLDRMATRGVISSVHRVKQIIGTVFRFAVAAGLADTDPTSALTRTLTPVKERHHAAVTDPAEISGLLRAIDAYSGDAVTRLALRLAPLVFVRPGELRHAEWSEIDFATSTWTIPAHKMKMREAHIVPLSTQAVVILEALRPLTGSGRYLFPSMRTPERPMSENTITAALRRMGYGVGEATGHGFRTTASTRLNEMGWDGDVIERQLAHAERNAVRNAYNRAAYLPERRKMMQAWADYLDQLAGRNVVQMMATAV